MQRRLGTTGRFLAAVWSRVSAGHFGLIAAGVAFYAMFAVFPGLAASIAIWSLWADPAVIADYLEVAEEFLPADAAVLVHDQVMALLAAPPAALGWASATSVAVALWSARAGVSALIAGLQVVHRANPRGWIAQTVMDLGLTAALILALFVAFATVVAVPLVLSLVTLGSAEAWLLGILPWAAMLLLVLTCLAILFRFGPNVQGAHVGPGVLVAALLWWGASVAFSAYLANFGAYNRVYGSIGAVAALLMWLYLSAWAVLLGGAINAELAAHRQPGDPQR
jgi:membrane protein